MSINKNVWAITDLQYGSSGKGFIAGLLSYHPEVTTMIRTGAPQAGHIVYFKGKKYIGRTIPVGRINPNLDLYVGPGGVIDLEVLEKEIQNTPYPVEDRLYISDMVAVVTPEDKAWEREYLKYGSTFEGIGAVRSKRAIRKAKLIKDYIKESSEYNWLKKFLISNEEYINKISKVKGKILLEGHQGFGLSNWFGSYPYVTSVDTTVSANLSEAGLPPQSVEHVFGVLRSYEIRIAGNSGPMKNEISWDEIPTKPEPEKTTVTKKTRRIGTIDWDLIKKAVTVNGVDQICMTHVDYIFNRNKGFGTTQTLNKELEEKRNIIKKIKEETNDTKIGVLNFSPKYDNLISLSDIFTIAYREIAKAENHE